MPFGITCRIQDKFIFSLYKNDIIGITYKSNPENEERYRFLSSKSDNPNRIEVKPIDRSKFEIQNQPTIGTKVLKFNKYYTDILGNVFNVTSEKLKFELNLISDRDSVENYSKIFTNLIKSYDLKSKIYNRYKKDKNYQLLHRDIQALEKLLFHIEDSKGLALIEEKINIEDYYDALLKLIKDDFILEEDSNIGGVKILNPISSRSFDHDILFVAGLSSKYYPKVKESNFFINDMNYRVLKEIGLDYKNYNYRLNNELIKFASIIASCRKILYLSLSEGKDEDNIFSIFLDEILNMFKGERPEEKVLTINLDFDYQIKSNIEDITRLDELSNYLLI